jgi:hypothetical protein
MVAGSALVLIGVFGLQAVAGAQDSGYPGSTSDNGSSQTLATVIVGSDFSGKACGYVQATPTTPGTLVTFKLPDGTVLGTATSDSTGCAAFKGTTEDPHISLNGGPLVSVNYGNSTILATGIGVDGNSITDTITVPLAPPADPPADPPAAAGLAFTGADIMALVIGGIALVAIGFLILTFVRRRTTGQTP